MLHLIKLQAGRQKQYTHSSPLAPHSLPLLLCLLPNTRALSGDVSPSSGFSVISRLSRHFVSHSCRAAKGSTHPCPGGCTASLPRGSVSGDTSRGCAVWRPAKQAAVLANPRFLTQAFCFLLLTLGKCESCVAGGGRMEQRELYTASLQWQQPGKAASGGFSLLSLSRGGTNGDGKVLTDPAGTGNVSVCCAISGRFHKVNKGLLLIH